jgi:AhpD family alkylhydroperoxidase
MTAVSPIAWVEDEAPGDGGETTPGAITHWHLPTIQRRKPRSTGAIAKRWRDIMSIYIGKRLEPGFREEIMLSVAGANSCRQCSFAHREWARAVGVSKAEIAAHEGMDASTFDERKWTAFVWAQAAGRSDFTFVPETIDADFRQEFAAQEQSDIELVATHVLDERDQQWRRCGVGARLRQAGGGERLPGYGSCRARRPLRALRPRHPERQAEARPHPPAPRQRPFFREFGQQMKRPIGPTTGPR